MPSHRFSARCRACLLAVLAVAGIASASDVPVEGVVPGVALPAAPKIDGVLEQGEWPDQARGSGFFDQDTAAPYDRPGEFWIAYDSQFVYFAARLNADPRDLTADEFRNNVSLGGNDHVFLSLDPYGALADFNRFGVNPQGATSIQIAGGRAAKTEWLGEFRAAGSIGEEAWVVEAAIPWAVMSLPAGGVRDLRFNIGWYVSRTQRTYQWRATQGRRERNGVWSGVDVPSIRRQLELNLLPYGYAGLDANDDGIFNAGLDAKTAIGDQIQLVGTVNPDFRNIETEILSLDFTYFERLREEGRPFFQEGDEFRPVGYGAARIFAPQRIAEVDFGLNTYGNLDDDSTFGLLTTSDFGRNQAVVAGYSQQSDFATSWSASYVGWFERGENNNAAHLSFDRQFDDWNLFSSVIYTSDEQEGNGGNYNLGVSYQRDGLEGSLFLTQVDAALFPRIGFAQEQDSRGLDLDVEQTWVYDRGPVMEAEVDVRADWRQRLNGDPYRKSARVAGSWTFRNGFDVSVRQLWRRFETFNDQLSTVNVEYPRGDPYRQIEGDLTVGQLRGRAYRSASMTALYRPFRRFQLNLTAQSVRHYRNREQIIASFTYDLGRFEQVGGRIVRQGDDWNWYVSYRLSGRRGPEYFVIFGDPNADTFQRTVILKGVFPVSVRL